VMFEPVSGGAATATAGVSPRVTTPTTTAAVVHAIRRTELRATPIERPSRWSSADHPFEDRPRMQSIVDDSPSDVVLSTSGRVPYQRRWVWLLCSDVRV
jgi:hypothetical protein